MSTFDPLRPDILSGQQQVGGTTSPLLSRRGTGPLAGYTVNFALNLTNFDWVTWHAYEWENWVVVDALLQDALYGIDIRGAWQPSTDYAAGEIVIDTTTGEILLSTTAHTSTDDIATDRAAELWEPYSVNEAFVGRGGDTMLGDLLFEGTNVAASFAHPDAPDVIWRLRNVVGTLSLDDQTGQRLAFTSDDVRAFGLVTEELTNESVMTLARSQHYHYTKTQQDQRNTTVDQSLANRYTKSEQDTTDNAQNTAINANAEAAQAAMDRANGRMRWRGQWVAGTYAFADVVQDGDFLFVANKSTEEKPDNGTNPPSPADWDLLVSGGGSSVHVGTEPPEQPLNGDQWFSTETPVGLYVYVEDGDTGQWIEANGGSIADHPDVATKAMLNRRNLLINGDFTVAQRGTSFSAFGYTLDRWVWNPRDGTGSVEALSPVAPEADQPHNYVVVTQQTAAVDVPYFRQRIEDVRTAAGQRVTVSFLLHADADTLVTALCYQNFGAGGETAHEVHTSDVTATGTWTRHSITFDVPLVNGRTIGVGHHLAFSFNFPTGTTFTVRIADVQLEVGSVATPFERRHITDELALCQRYYWQGQPAGKGLGNLYAPNAATVWKGPAATFSTPMRVTPTVSIITAPTYQNCSDGGIVASHEGFEHRLATAGAANYRAHNGVYAADAEL